MGPGEKKPRVVAEWRHAGIRQIAMIAQSRHVMG
ncbi:hypothetical protein IL54_0140 [Sphingobium sp. ba1]|nr:hypothetical protein IL54_0140 [Sphingobium sp. ba1]